MTKAELRKIYLKKRADLSGAEYQRLNDSLCEQFFRKADLSEINVLHTFLPIQKTKEVDTWRILERVKSDFPNVSVSVPRVNNATSELEHYYLEDPNQLAVNTWGIPEPVNGTPTPTEKIDAVLVPLLAFDRQGHRLGYGRGFYDRFLKACRPDCLKIGLSLFEAVEKIDDTNENDVALDLVVTPFSVDKPRRHTG